MPYSLDDLKKRRNAQYLTPTTKLQYLIFILWQALHKGFFRFFSNEIMVHYMLVFRFKISMRKIGLLRTRSTIISIKSHLRTSPLWSIFWMVLWHWPKLAERLAAWNEEYVKVSMRVYITHFSKVPFLSYQKHQFFLRKYTHSTSHFKTIFIIFL